jgi:hypothetical protein
MLGHCVGVIVVSQVHARVVIISSYLIRIQSSQHTPTTGSPLKEMADRTALQFGQILDLLLINRL